MSRNTVARINLAALRRNLAAVKELALESKVVSVIKADAYGHGIERVARALNHTDVFAVATPGEAQAVRQSGWTGRLLLLEGIANSDDFIVARQLGLELVVHHAYQLEHLKQHGYAQRLWLKLDTGMHRLGFPVEDLDSLLLDVSEVTPAIEPVLMTHFACADEPGNSMTQGQISRFSKACQPHPNEQSLCNSAGIINFTAACREYVRPGIMLYGISPNPHQTGADIGLEPVMTLSCELIAINQCKKGDKVGYGAAYECAKDMKIGVAAIGYGDGYPRHLRNGAPVLINGRRARLAGRVSMDLITIDLGEHDDVRPGDQVVLWGDELPVEELALWADAIPYELVCGVTGRVDRVEF